MKTADAIALASAVVAALALGLTVWTARLTQQHNRKSVRPLLRIDADTRDGHDVELRALNRGVGPARITCFAIGTEGRMYEIPTRKDLAQMLHGLGVDPNHYQFSAEIPTRDEVLSAGESFSILLFKASGGNKKLHDELVAILPKIKTTIAYRDIYDQDFRLDHAANI